MHAFPGTPRLSGVCSCVPSRASFLQFRSSTRLFRQIHAKTLAFRTPGAKLIAVSDIFEEAGARVVEGCNGIPKYYKVCTLLASSLFFCCGRQHHPTQRSLVLGTRVEHREVSTGRLVDQPSIAPSRFLDHTGATFAFPSPLYPVSLSPHAQSILSSPAFAIVCRAVTNACARRPVLTPCSRFMSRLARVKRSAVGHPATRSAWVLPSLRWFCSDFTDSKKLG